MTVSGRWSCSRLSDTEFQNAGGVSPYTVTVVFDVSDAGLISDMEPSISEWDAAGASRDGRSWTGEALLLCVPDGKR